MAALVLRAVVVYAFLLAALRLGGRRELGQMTSFDLVLLLLVLSNAVQNAMNAGDSSLAGGLVSAITLVGLNWAVGWASYRWRWFERLLQGKPRRIVSDGKVHLGELQRGAHHPGRAAVRPAQAGDPTDGRVCRGGARAGRHALRGQGRRAAAHDPQELAHPDDRYRPPEAG